MPIDATGLVRFRFEVPGSLVCDLPRWADIYGRWRDSGEPYTLELFREDFDRDVVVVQGHCTRRVLAEVGPLIEQAWRST